MSNQTIESAKKHPIFQSTLKDLITNRFYSENYLEEKKTKVEFDNLSFSAWLASIIASSNEEEDKQLASVFGILLFLENSNNISLVKSSYVILSRSGNLIASRFFENIFEYDTERSVDERELKAFKTYFGTILNYELGAKLSKNEIDAGEIKFIGSDYQKSLWKSLSKTENNLAISAPTSAGKSFVLQNFLYKIFNDRATFFAIYIVPTRALISQVAERLKSVLPSDVSLNTAFVENENPDLEQFQKKELFIVTPERCLKLIQYSYKINFKPDLIFIDEIQNIEGSDSRSFLLEYLINEIKVQWPTSRIITAGPFINNPEILFEQLFQLQGEKKQTMFSPVFQLKVSLKLPETGNNEILASLHFQREIINTVPIQLEVDIRSLLKKYKGRALVEVVKYFGKDTKNIIYSSRTDYAEYYAFNLSKLLPVKDNISPDVKELMKLVEEEIHGQYYLLDTLKSNTAFHHSKLPEIIRGEIEYLFSSGKLDNLVCTATLMEGVNLPAQKVFILTPKKDQIPLSSFEFGNIIGRAGRIRDSLIGSIYCLQTENDSWAEEKYNSVPEKDIEPAIYKVLSIPKDSLIGALNSPMDSPSREHEHAVSFLKHKFLNGEVILRDYLIQKKLNVEVTDEVLNLLKNRLSSLTIPYELLRLNPNIDPELQNVLYSTIKADGIENWVLHDNENFYKYWKRALRIETPHKTNNLLGQLETLLTKLDSIFAFQKETYFKQQISRSIPQMSLYAVKWMQNASLKDLIKAEIKFYGSHDNPKRKINPESRKEVNTLINEVIKLFSNVVSFILVKYLKLLSDILKTILTEEEKEKYKYTLSLHVMLELGTQNSVVLLLISKGVSRSVAIKLLPLIPEEFHEKPTEWLQDQTTLALNPVYLRHLKRKKIIQ